MADKEFGFSIKVLGTEEQVSNLGKVESQLKAIAQQRSDLNKKVKEGTLTEEEYGQNIADLNLKTKSLRDSKRQLERSIDVENELLDQQGGSYNQLSSQINKLRQQYRNMSEEERNSARGQEILQKIDTLDTELKGIDASMGQYQRNVGNYSSAFGSLGSQLGQLSPTLGQVQSQYQQINNVLIVVKESLFGQAVAQDAATTAAVGGTAAQEGLAISTKATTGVTKGQITALKALRIALMATGIGAIVVLLGSLLAALVSTQRGMDGVNSVLRPLSAFFQRLFGVIQNVGLGVFDQLKKAISDPKQALIDFGNAIKENIINRIEAIPKLFTSALSLTTNVFKSFGLRAKTLLADIPIIGKNIDATQAKKELAEVNKSIKDNALELADSVIQAGTGVEEGTKKLQDFFEQSGEFIAESIEAGNRIHQLQIQIEEIEIRNARLREKLLADVKRYNDIAEDTKKTEQERADAALKAIDANDKVLKLDKELIQAKIRLKEEQNSLNDTSRSDELELEELRGELFRKETERQEARTTLRNKFNIIEEQAERERLKLIKENNRKILEAATKFYDAHIDQLDTHVSKRIELLDQLTQLQILSVQKRLRDEVISEKEAQDEIFEIQQESFQKQLKAREIELIGLTNLREELQERLGNLFEQEENERTEVMRQQLEGQLNELELHYNEVKIIIEEVTKKWDEARKAQESNNPKSGESLFKLLFGIDADNNLVNQIGSLMQSLYQGVFQLKQQELEKSLNKELEMVEAQQNKALEATQARYKKEKRLLQQKLDEGEISQEEYNERLAHLDSKLSHEKERIDERYAQKEEALREQAFEREKRLSISRAYMDAALAVIKAFATMDPISAAIYASTVGVTTGFQISQIQAQEYALGGMLDGPSHARGGIPIVAEGGEAVINKRSMASRDVLNLSGTPYEIASAINAYKGYGKAFGMGGQVPYPAPPISQSRNISKALTGIEMNQIADRIIKGITIGVNDKKVILVQGDREDFDNEVLIVKQSKQWST